MFRNALNGDEELLILIADKYRPKKTNTDLISKKPVIANDPALASKQADEERPRKNEDTKQKQGNGAPKRPTRPPYLSFDAMKQPFLRPRFGRHNQSLSMTLLSRTVQHQKRMDRQTQLAWTHFYATAEEMFYEKVGRPDAGWVDEITLAQSHLSLQLDESELAKAKRWDKIEELHRRLTAEYERDMEQWKLEISQWKDSRKKQ